MNTALTTGQPGKAKSNLPEPPKRRLREQFADAGASGHSLYRRVRLFRGAIGIRCWHHYGKPHGTAIRWMRCKPGLVGVMVKDGGLHVGIWWQWRFEMVAVHVTQFEPNDEARHGGKEAL